MDIPTKNTFGQFQSSSSEEEQIEEIVSSTENSEISVEEEDEEEADPEAFAPAAIDDCLDIDEHMSEENAASREVNESNRSHSTCGFLRNMSGTPTLPTSIKAPTFSMPRSTQS